MRAPRGVDAPQTILFLVDDAKAQIVEPDLPLTVVGLFNGEGLAHQRGGDADQFAAPSDFAIGAHPAHSGFGGIIGLGQANGHGARRGDIKRGGRILTERLMRTLFVIVALEACKATLLRLSVGAWGKHRFQQGQMEAFVAPVLLGTARIDAFVFDASLAHQTDSAVRPVTPLEANGAPLSERSVSGRP